MDEQLTEIRRFVRQIWIMIIILIVLIGLPLIVLVCSTMGLIAVEFFPH